MSGAAPRSASTLSAATRLCLFATAVALVTTRVGLVVHELIGHGGAANVVGAGVDDVRLFWFAGGWIQYSRDAPWTVSAALIVQLAGIAVELVVGLAAVGWARRRAPSWGRVAILGAGAGWVIHAGAYLAIGTWHGLGDGTGLHRALGGAMAAVAVPAGLGCIAVAYLAARALVPAFEAIVPAPSRAARLAAVAAALATAGGINAGLSRLELAARRDPTYGAIMRPEREREIERELAAWLAARRARGLDDDPNATARAQEQIAARHRTFPFGVLLVLGIAGAVIAGAIRARPGRGPTAPDLPPVTLVRVTVAAGFSVALVVAAGAAFPI